MGRKERVKDNLHNFGLCITERLHTQELIQVWKMIESFYVGHVIVGSQKLHLEFRTKG